MYIALYSILQKKILFPWCTKNVRKKADVFLVAFDHKYLFLSDILHIRVGALNTQFFMATLIIICNLQNSEIWGSMYS